MSYLLDTHAFLWFVQDDAALSPRVRNLIETTSGPVSISLASCWEITIKYKTGKLKLDEAPKIYLPNAISRASVELLVITMADLAQLDDLPLNQQRDPFDRLIAAQSLNNSLTLLSRDVEFDQYGIVRIWD